MAYYAHYDVWQAVASICRQHGYVLTVYIDDVTVSGASVSATVMWRIKHVIHRSGLRYHKEKAFFDRPSEITGVIVDGVRLIVPNRQHRKVADLRRQIRLATDEEEAAKLSEKLTGLHAQTRQIARSMGGAAA